MEMFEYLFGFQASSGNLYFFIGNALFLLYVLLRQAVLLKAIELYQDETAKAWSEFVTQADFFIQYKREELQLIKRQAAEFLHPRFTKTHGKPREFPDQTDPLNYVISSWIRWIVIGKAADIEHLWSPANGDVCYFGYDPKNPNGAALYLILQPTTQQASLYRLNQKTCVLETLVSHPSRDSQHVDLLFPNPDRDSRISKCSELFQLACTILQRSDLLTP